MSTGKTTSGRQERGGWCRWWGVGNLVFCIVQPGHQPDDNFLEPGDTSQVRLGKPGRDKETTDFCDHRLLEGGRVLLLSVHHKTIINWKFKIMDTIKIFYSHTSPLCPVSDHIKCLYDLIIHSLS